MGALVQRIEIDTSFGGSARGRRVPVRLRDGGQPVEDGRDGPFDGDGLRRTPVVELRAVPEREPREQWSAGQVRRRLQHRLLVRRERLLDGLDVDARGREVELDRGSIHAHPSVAKRRPQHRKRAPQGAPRGLIVGIRPKERRQLLARERTLLDGEQGKDRERLAGIDDDGDSVDGHLEGSEDMDREATAAG